MSKNNDLNLAKKAKKDEFYTQVSDIEKECKHYKPHFFNKIVLCNCNDALHTGFATYFSLNFEALGLKELICTTFAMAEDEKAYVYRYHGDKNGNRVPDIEEWDKTELNGNGGFNTEEGITLIQEADIIVTNPPFSLFGEFIATLERLNKKYLIIGNMNSVHHKDIFPLFKNNQVWYGVSIHSGGLYFKVSSDYKLTAQFLKTNENGDNFICVKGVRWFTNIENVKRHEKLDLYKRYTPEEYPKYDNYNAINVNKTCDIPTGYDGVMGVPITFLDKYCPEQFEIIGTLLNGRINGKNLYARILIKKV